MLGTKSRDGAGMNTSRGGDLVSRLARIKEVEDMVLLS